MAEITSKADLIKAGYGGYIGWGETEALADYRATGGQGKYDPTTPGVAAAQGVSYTPAVAPTQSPIESAKQWYGLAQEFAQPAISRLEATKPALETRYQQLLSDITGYTTKATSAEFSRRGIPLSSGIYETALAEKIEPRVQAVGAMREESYADLERAIAAVESSYGPEAIQAAQSMYSTQEASRASAAQLALQQATQAFEREQYEWQKPYEERMYEYQLGQPYYAPTQQTQWQSQQTVANQVLAQAKKGATLSQLVSQFGGGIDVGEIVRLYTGVNYYGPPTEAWAQQYISGGYSTQW